VNRRLKATIAVLALVVAGCAGRLPTFSDSPRVEREVARIAVHEATFAFVRGDADRARRVVSVCDQVLATDADAMVTVDSLKALIPWGELNPQQRLDAEALFDLVAAELSARIPAGEHRLPIEDVKVVTGWVREAAFTFVAPPQ
jgi:hypothetical protein